ncbi:hypothetical protein FZI91_03655 [Mycobacterium sp. CBMA271]|uniref:hypothetical protein n=1 Tax=unclassified Mycobacteroides TaxID=2618759 RepID=UPI0012DFA1A7|nr:MULTISPECIES: hypothetical protein [unclassified Mycobacteroides]MUM18215.1 hypothetical protein [Mycobacteroides sp. CBMA 326]MUM20802.1 hypothetical protein [Mycobacteroides sp. CBMA 271]
MRDDDKTRLCWRWPDGAQADSRSLILVGDSDAGQFAEAFIPAAAQQNWTMIFAANSACRARAQVPAVVVHTPPHFVNWDLDKCPGYEV